MTEREALKHLKATIEAFGPDEGIELDQKAWRKLHSAINEVLAQPALASEQRSVSDVEPVAWMSEENDCLFFDKDKPHPMAYDFWTPLYTTPPQHALMAEHWKAEYDKLKAACKPLTDEQIEAIAKNYALINPTTPLHFARAIEAAHGIKGEL